MPENKFYDNMLSPSGSTYGEKKNAKNSNYTKDNPYVYQLEDVSGNINYNARKGYERLADLKQQHITKMETLKSLSEVNPAYMGYYKMLRDNKARNYKEMFHNLNNDTEKANKQLKDYVGKYLPNTNITNWRNDNADILGKVIDIRNKEVEIDAEKGNLIMNNVTTPKEIYGGNKKAIESFKGKMFKNFITNEKPQDTKALNLIFGKLRK